MAHGRPELDWKAESKAEAFRCFKARMLLYLDDMEVIDGAKQATKIKLSIGDEGMRRLMTSGLNDEEMKSPDHIFDFLESQLDASAKINFRVHRLEFAHIRQSEGETTRDFIARLREKASKCEFETAELNERLIEMLILSTPHEDFRKDLLTKPKKFPIAEALEKGAEYEAIMASQTSLHNLCTSYQACDRTPTTIDSTGSRPSNPCQNCGCNHKQGHARHSTTRAPSSKIKGIGANTAG